MSEIVKFNQNGEYQVGKPIQEMDVEDTQAKPKQPRTSHVSMHLPPQTQGDKVAPRPKFNLNTLKQKAAMEPTTPTETEQAKDVTGDKDPKSTGEVEVKDTATSTEPKEIESKEQVAIVEEADTDTEVPTSVEPMEEPEVIQEPEPKISKTAVPFKLNQLGLTTAVEKVNESTSEQGGTEQMRTKKDKDIKVEKATGTETTGTSAEVKEMSITGDAAFEVISLNEMLKVGNVSEEILLLWLTKVVKEHSNRPTTIFSCATSPKLKVYSVTYPKVARGKTSGVCVTIGVGKNITACILNTKSKSLGDMSGEVVISGTCATLQGVPVASCSQRDKESVTL